MQPAMPFRDPKQSNNDDHGDCAIATTTTSCSIATTSSTTTRCCLDLILSLFFCTALHQSIMQTFPFTVGVSWFMEMGLRTIL
ncbi:hypothetical protein AMTRI_Chr11g153980 [Amborella trichopoda]